MSKSAQLSCLHHKFSTEICSQSVIMNKLSYYYRLYNLNSNHHVSLLVT